MASFDQVMNMGSGISMYQPTPVPGMRPSTGRGGAPTALSSLMGATPSGMPSMPGGMSPQGMPGGLPTPQMDPFAIEPGPFPPAPPFPRLTMGEVLRLLQMRERFEDPEPGT